MSPQLAPYQVPCGPLFLDRAGQEDIAALTALEYSVFSGDCISRRSWRNLIASQSATVLVVRGSADLWGACVLLHSARSSVARVYSLAVSPAMRGRGLATLLLHAARERARALGTKAVRLETRMDNHAAQALFRSLGFAPLDVRHDYYEDGADALRFEQCLAEVPKAPSAPVALVPKAEHAWMAWAAGKPRTPARSLASTAEVMA